MPAALSRTISETAVELSRGGFRYRSGVRARSSRRSQYQWGWQKSEIVLEEEEEEEEEDEEWRGGRVQALIASASQSTTGRPLTSV